MIDTMVRRKQQAEAPWEPFWDFVLGDWEVSESEKRKGFFRSGKEEATEQQPQPSEASFLDTIFPQEDEARESAPKRETSHEKRQSSFTKRSSGGSSKEQRRRLLRRKRNEPEQEEESWNISSTLHPFLYNSDEASEQQITRSWRSKDASDAQSSTDSRSGRKKSFWKRKEEEKEEQSAAWDVTSGWETFITNDGAESPQKKKESGQNDVSEWNQKKSKSSKNKKLRSPEEAAYKWDADNSLIDTSPLQRKESYRRNQKESREGSETKQIYSLSQPTGKSSSKNESERKKRGPRERKRDVDSLSDGKSSLTFLDHLADSLVGVSLSEDTDTITSRGESTHDSSLQTEEVSQATEDTSRAIRNMIAPKVSNADKSATKPKVTEVRLQFTPALSEDVEALLPPVGQEEFPCVPFDESRKAVEYCHQEKFHNSAGTTVSPKQNLVMPEELPQPKSWKSNTSASLTVPFDLPQPRSWKSNGSSLEQNTSRGIVQARNGFDKIVCCSVKNLSDEASVWTMRTGIPIQELSREELSAIFPRLRVVSDDNGLLPAVNRASELVGNSQYVETKLPAHLQATVAATGPQSLYEYEYERGRHMNVVYTEFGPNPHSLLQVLVYDKPPERITSGLITYNKVVVQVEVCSMSN